ncbi:hypothetical protein AGLY_001328 [Aphis glycines]|uniref:Uncharacterized protein n=1 Tax=Aphis glycines TaxID=307491 RepID=A0A6G0U9H6_APHGL|nr:hypothetical protein AGLY_001328 [Aphis glycines]
MDIMTFKRKSGTGLNLLFQYHCRHKSEITDKTKMLLVFKLKLIIKNPLVPTCTVTVTLTVLRTQYSLEEIAAAAMKVGDRSRITDDKLWNRDTGLRQKRGSAGAVVGQSTNQTQPTVFRFDTRRESKISIPAVDLNIFKPVNALYHKELKRINDFNLTGKTVLNRFYAEFLLRAPINNY